MERELETDVGPPIVNLSCRSLTSFLWIDRQRLTFPFPFVLHQPRRRPNDSVVVFSVEGVHERQTIGQKLPLDAINPAHGSLLRLNSPSTGIFYSSMELDSRRKRGRLSPTHPRDYMRSMGRSSLTLSPRSNPKKVPSERILFEHLLEVLESREMS